MDEHRLAIEDKQEPLSMGEMACITAEGKRPGLLTAMVILGTILTLAFTRLPAPYIAATCLILGWLT